MVAPIAGWLGEWSRAVGEHHERWDGDGYPNGFAANEIHLGARIVAVADAFDVMTSARSYKKPMPTEAAREEIARCSGGQFDPEIVRAFLNIGIGRLRLAMGPLTWLANIPSAGQIPIAPVATPLANVVASAVGATAAVVTGGAGILVPDDISVPEPLIAFADDEPIGTTVPAPTTTGAPVVTIPVASVTSVPATTTTTSSTTVPESAPTTQAPATTTPPTTIAAPVVTIPTPVGNDSSVNIDEDQPVTLSLSGVTGSGSPVFEIVIAPQNGSLTKVATNVAGTAGEELWEYVPDTDFSGTDSFVYQVCDNRGTCDVANIEIVVTPQNDAPIPGADEVQANEDQPLTIAISTLTDNDTDVDSDPTFASFSQPENGSISEDAAGNLIYTPDPGFEGIDTFTYTSVDGEHTVTQTVRVVVLATPDSPVAVADVFAGTEDTNLAIAFTELLANDFDPDPADLPAFASYTQPANGTLSTGLTGDLVYTPDANFNGTDTFTYTITDGTNTDTGTVDIELEAVNDSPVALDDSFSTPEDTAAVLSRASILANDNDVESPLVLDGFTQPANGTLLLDGNDDLVYTPNANFNGVDTFAYTVTDGALVANAEVKIDVESVNDVPIAVDDLVSTDEDTNAAIPLAGLLGNDSDLDSSPTIDSFTQPANGTVTTGLTGDYVYTPKANFNGTDTFTYTITDGTATDTATVTITVTPVNDLPIAAADAASIDEDNTLPFSDADILANDIDVESLLSITSLSQPANGSVTTSPTGDRFYTPNANFHGTDTFTYTVTDGAASSTCLLYTSPSPRDATLSRMPSSA